MLVLDGAYLLGTEPLVFRRIAPPSAAELQALVERLAERPRAGQKVFSLQTSRSTPA
jgi:hypothetical protein